MADRHYTRPDGPLITVPPTLRTPEALDARRHVRLDGAYNFRDLGGYRTAEGSTVRWGQVYRSDHLADLTDADREVIAGLGLRTVIDFRLPSEREQRPSRLPPGPHVVHLGMSDRPKAAEGVRTVQAAIAGEAPPPGWTYWFDTYHDMLDEAGDMFVQTMETLADADRLPALFHCTGGKDRTGVAAVLLLDLLGVPAEALLDDFELTNMLRTPVRFRQIGPGLTATGVSDEDVLTLVGVVRAAMADAYRRVVEEHGGAVAYLTEHGLDPATPDRLRHLLLGPPG